MLPLKRFWLVLLALAVAGASMASCDPTEEQKLQIVAASFVCGATVLDAAKPCTDECITKYTGNPKACALNCLEEELTKAGPTCSEQFARLKGEEFARAVRLLADSLVNLWEVSRPKASTAVPAPGPASSPEPAGPPDAPLNPYVPAALPEDVQSLPAPTSPAGPTS